MNTANELVSNLTAKGVQFRVEGEDLKLNAPRGVVTPDVLAEIKQRKLEIIRLVKPIDELTPEDLNGSDLDAWLGWYTIMMGPPWYMDQEEAERKSINLLKESMKVLREK